MTQYLTTAQILFLHARLIAETGGSHGLRDLGMLEAATARPQATLDGEELYPTLFVKAAALMDSLIHNHPFLDGNKRTGYATMEVFLLMSGYELSASVDDSERTMLLLASGDLTRSELTDWIRDHMKSSGARCPG